MTSKKVTKYFQNAFLNKDCSVSAEEMADKIGVKTPTLYGKLDPNLRASGKSKGNLSVDEAVELMRLTQNVTPIAGMAKESGVRFLIIRGGRIEGLNWKVKQDEFKENSVAPKSDPSLPSKSWEIFAFARGLLSTSSLCRIFNVEHAQICRWAKAPAVFDDSSRNPVDTVTTMLREIAEAGEKEGREVVRIALNSIGKECGFKVANLSATEPTAEDLRADFLEIFNRLHELQASAHKHESPLVVEAYADKAAEALSAFVLRYAVDYQDMGGRVMFSRGSTETEKTSLWHRLKMKFL
ncbi:phage regulatory CII family protein [Maridesulfovibrio bastinii]|uniref:phage regulatory CII family protein n=1 Tax=Maridesulfovibrio bastinii TaxID=47157 RepID=UPI0004070E1A|nr:phage regulatory CII family protein [Maridesulfovibrio bastinii]